MVKLNYKLSIYYVNPDSKIYQKYHVKRVLDKFNASITIPYIIKKIYIKDIDKISINHLIPIETTFVLVLLPTRRYIFNFETHSGAIIVYLSFHPGNSKYSYAFNYPPLTIVKYYLLDGRPFSFKHWLYQKIKQDGRILMIISASVFESIDQLTELYKRILKLNISSKQRFRLLNILKIKKHMALNGGKNV